MHQILAHRIVSNSSSFYPSYSDRVYLIRSHRKYWRILFLIASSSFASLRLLASSCLTLISSWFLSRLSLVVSRPIFWSSWATIFDSTKSFNDSYLSRPYRARTRSLIILKFFSARASFSSSDIPSLSFIVAKSGASLPIASLRASCARRLLRTCYSSSGNVTCTWNWASSFLVSNVK